MPDRIKPSPLRAAFAAFTVAESGRFILFLPVFMAGGVIAYFAWPHEPRVWPAALLAALLLPAAIRTRTASIQAGCLCAVLFAAGFASAGRATWSAPPWVELPRRAALVTGEIAALDILPEGRRVSLAAPRLDGGAPLPRGLRIRLRDSDQTSLQPGDAIQIRALLRAPSPPSYPGGWDTQREAFFTGLGGYGFALGPATRLAKAAPSRWQAVRGAIAARITAGLPGPRGAIAATLLTGMGSAIPAEDRRAFQASGLAHLLAVAGLHIGIVMGLAYTACRRGLSLSEHVALFWPTKQIACLISLAVGFAYLALTGAHVPILRSFAMACLVALAVLTGRRALSWRALGLAAVLLMLASPEQVMGVSFQMSFAAVMALIAGWEVLSPRLARLQEGRARTLARHGIALLATSALAGTASLPVAAYHFGTATPYYVPANLVAVPLTALWVMPWGMVALLLMPLGLQALALAPMGWGIGALLWIARAVAAWPAAEIAVPQMPPAALLCIMGGLIWLCLWRTRLRLAGLGGFAAGLAICTFAARPDIVVSPDARLIAARYGGQVHVSAASGLARFDRETPERIWGVADGQIRPFACDAAACRLDIAGRTAVLMQDVQAPCDGAQVAVSHLRASCASAPIVDALTTEAAGATTIRLTRAGPVLRTDADERGDRPWVLRAPVVAVTSRLPPALTE